jgi:hypothetical protein
MRDFKELLSLLRDEFGWSTVRKACALILFVWSLPAQSVTLYDNLPQPSGGSDAVVVLGPLYDSFSTGSNSGLLSALTLLLQGDNTSAGFVSVGLYADSGSTTPGALVNNLATIPDARLASGGGQVDVPLTVEPELEPLTRYWIGLTGPDSTGEWLFTLGFSGTGVAGEYYQNVFGTFPVDPSGGYQMDVELTPSAEPSTMLLAACSFAVLTLLRRRFAIK